MSSAWRLSQQDQPWLGAWNFRPPSSGAGDGLITDRLCLHNEDSQIPQTVGCAELLSWWTHAHAGRVVHPPPRPGGTSSPHGAAGPGPLWPCLGLPWCNNTQLTGRASGKCWQVSSLEAALSTKGRAQVGTSASCPSTGNPKHTCSSQRTKPQVPTA